MHSQFGIKAFAGLKCCRSKQQNYMCGAKKNLSSFDTKSLNIQGYVTQLFLCQFQTTQYQAEHEPFDVGCHGES